MDWQTHAISNQVDELTGYDLYATDPALQQAVARGGATWCAAELQAQGRRLGQAETFAQAALANRHPPELQTHDARGRRIDRVDFHPAWHALMGLAREHGLIRRPFATDQPGRWTAWAASFYLHGQVEAGTLCPATMTQAAIPLLQREPALWTDWGERLLSPQDDMRDLPGPAKRAAWIGMGMTEKQGGSDVRANTTTATPLGAGGRGQAYALRGHKWFFSAPMCDAHLVVAQVADGGPSCFFVPRWCADGSRNAVQVQRLKDKLGNRSNSSSEVEFLDAHSVLIGEPGRGIPTIIEMATYTRLNCVLGSAALLRQALVQALAYARRRQAFGRRLVEQPLMRAVLADLALESEAALVLAMQLARAFEDGDTPSARAWKRILTPAAKFWVCKRAVELSGEAMEVFGGNGYVADSIMARLFREAPVNSIWEGSGNVMCLDVLRALGREPEAAAALLAELRDMAGDEPRLRAEAHALQQLLTAPDLEARGRQITGRLALLAQAALLRRDAPPAIAEAFIASRCDPAWGRVCGQLDLPPQAIEALLQRALPG